MSEKLEVSFNSPQCGWMSVGFSIGENEFHTTTAHAPYEDALSNLLQILSNLLGAENREFRKILKWNRNPEAFDFAFYKNGEKTLLEIMEYPTENRDEQESEKVFSYEGETREICEAFYQTFEQLYVERFEDEFEENWHQPFPLEEFKNFKAQLAE